MVPYATGNSIHNIHIYFTIWNDPHLKSFLKGKFTSLFLKLLNYFTRKTSAFWHLIHDEVLIFFLYISNLLDAKITGPCFCPNSNDLGQEPAGSLQPGQAGEKEEAGAGCEQWGLDSSWGAIKSCTVSKWLGELLPCTGKFPSGRDRSEEGKSFLPGAESRTRQEGRASREIQMASKS